MKVKLLVSFVLAASIAGLFAASASAYPNQILFCGSGEIYGNNRCVAAAYVWLYGVGVTTFAWGNPNQHLCVGAKTNGDGSGGNALPFRCEYLGPNQTMWTPGGNSNWGYPTIINRDAFSAYGSGIMYYEHVS